MSDDSNLIIAAAGFCPNCGQRGRILQARVTRAKVADGAWVASGHLDVHPAFFCPNCGQSLAEVEHEVPIQCAGLTCPKCGLKENLSYGIRELDNEELTFTVVIECRKCSRKKTISKVLSKLLSLVKISVGPVGISAKVEGKEKTEE